jgi:hypothetical protein
MPAEFDSSEFVDPDYQPVPGGSVAPTSGRPPSREELDTKVGITQHRLAELKRAQELLERERAALEEARRRQNELQTGRQEIIQALTRGVGLLEESEFNFRRDAEQMLKTLGDLRDSLLKVQGIQQETWTKDDYEIQLTRALTTIENARMEWNSARLKWPMLSETGDRPSAPATKSPPWPTIANHGEGGSLWRLGLALTWPLALIGAGILGALILLLLRQ